MASKKEGGKKRRKPAKKRPKRSSKDLVNYRRMHALSKRVRVRILAVLCERVASPKEISQELDEGLSQVSYHVKVQRECCLIVEDHKFPRPGAVERVYRAEAPTFIPPNAPHHLPPTRGKRISA